MDIEKEVTTFPTTRYQGSKRKIIPWIYDCIKDLNFNTALDAFGGSGVVSLLLKRMGKGVTYNDILLFNKIVGDSFISNNNVTISEDDITHLFNHKPHKRETFIADNFKDIYYLEEENIWIDNLIQKINDLNLLYSGEKLKYKQAIAYNALFQSCLIKRPYNLFHRNNLNMRTRDVKRNFGNKTAWETPFEIHFRKFIKEINGAVCESSVQCMATNKDVFEIDGSKYDLIYIDPPYIKKNSTNESGNYLKCYHFLEGIANYAQWKEILDENTPNKRIGDSFLPNYFTPSQAYYTFERLISRFQHSIIVISYKYGGLPSIDELTELLKTYKTSVKVFDKHYKYALNKQNGDAVLNREYILIGY